MIIVHHLNSSRSHRVLWLLEELGVPYEIKHYQRRKSMLAPESLKAVHPLGKSPVITDGGLTIAESGAIIEYLIERYGQGKLRPEQEVERLRYTYWLHYAEGSAMLPMVMSIIFRQIERAPMPFFVRPLTRKIVEQVRRGYIGPQLDLHMNYMEAELQKTPWFAGRDFSAADIQMSYPIDMADKRGLLGTHRPALTDFLTRIRSRPPYQRALEKGGPLDLT